MNVPVIIKTAYPVVTKIAISPMRIMQAGVNRANNHSRELIKLLNEQKLAPTATSPGEAYFTIVNNGNKLSDLFRRVDNSVMQVEKMAPSTFIQGNKHNTGKYEMARHYVLSRLLQVRDNVKKGLS